MASPYVKRTLNTNRSPSQRPARNNSHPQTGRLNLAGYSSEGLQIRIKKESNPFKGVLNTSRNALKPPWNKDRKPSTRLPKIDRKPSKVL